MNLNVVIAAAIVLAAFSQAHAIEPIAVDWIQKGGEIVPPATLKEGTARLHDVEQWTQLLRAGLDVERTDLNADGHLDALAEMAHARGATGNRVYLAFIQSDGRFRYVGETSRIARTLTYAESHRTYIVQVWDNGPGVDVSLWHLRDTGLTKVGRTLDLRAGDSGPAKHQELYRDLSVRVMSENRLLAVFAPPLPEGRDFVDPAEVAPAWNNPNGWSAADVALSDGVIQATITSKKPLAGLRSTPAGETYQSRLMGQLVHLRGNSYVILLPDDPKRYSTAHVFVVFYREEDAVRFVFSANLLEAENM